MSAEPSRRPIKKSGKKKAREADIYFLMAPPRHGAVQLAAVLNLHKRIASFGTANPKRGEDEPCSCGQPVSSCPFWSDVWDVLAVPEVFPDVRWFPSSPVVFVDQRMNTALISILSTLALKTGNWPWNIIREPVFTFFDLHTRFLEACQVWHPHLAFVDAQGSIPKLMAMVGMGFPVKGVFHVVQDPRHYAAWSKRYYPEIPVEKAVKEWKTLHKAIIGAKNTLKKDVKFHVVRFEDLMGDIETESKKIIQIMKLKDEGQMDDTLSRDKNHSLGLSDMDGLDVDWREILSQDEQRRVIKAAGRLFIEFGYKVES
jgi:hypothetical protein